MNDIDYTNLPLLISLLINKIDLNIDLLKEHFPYFFPIIFGDLNITYPEYIKSEKENFNLYETVKTINESRTLIIDNIEVIDDLRAYYEPHHLFDESLKEALKIASKKNNCHKFYDLISHVYFEVDYDKYDNDSEKGFICYQGRLFNLDYLLKLDMCAYYSNIYGMDKGIKIFSYLFKTYFRKE